MAGIEYFCLADGVGLGFRFDLEKINVTVFVYFLYTVRTKFIYVTYLSVMYVE